MPKFTVTVTFYDGFTSTRDLLDVWELSRYTATGVAWHLVKSLEIQHNPPHPES